MIMPYARHGKTKIYYEVIGEGPALVLQHGYTHDLHDWHHFGWVAALQSEYRLILIDARGAGASDMPHDPNDYSMELFAGDVTAVLDHTGIDRTHFFGYSRGSLIGCAVARYAPQRLLSLILGGHFPEANPAAKERARNQYGKGMGAYYEQDSSPGLIFTPDLMARKYGNDAEALIAAAVAPGTAETIAALTIPCLLYSGEEDSSYDQVKRILPQAPKARFFSVPGLGHGQAFRYSHRVLPQIKQFLREVTPLAEQNQALVRRIIRALNTADYDTLEQYYHSDWHINGDTGPTRNVRQWIQHLFNLFPDAEAHVTNITADDDSVTTEWVFKGTRSGKWDNTESAGARITIRGTIRDRIRDGQIIESTLSYDTADLERQLAIR
jgi:pimeloyl-ACP methyl ester carboxylesterase/predicted ester cyclase